MIRQKNNKSDLPKSVLLGTAKSTLLGTVAAAVVFLPGFRIAVGNPPSHWVRGHYNYYGYWVPGHWS